jgi:tRNA dimethylallyltransferase
MSPDLASSIASLPPHLLSLYNSLPRQPPSAATDPDAAFDLHALLLILDQSVARRWHWRDTRKVLRSIRVIKESGRRASDIIGDQSNDISKSQPRSVFTFSSQWILIVCRFHTLCFWLYAEPSVLDFRLNERVDKMIEVQRPSMFSVFEV